MTGAHTAGAGQTMLNQGKNKYSILGEALFKPNCIEVKNNKHGFLSNYGKLFLKIQSISSTPVFCQKAFYLVPTTHRIIVIG